MGRKFFPSSRNPKYDDGLLTIVNDKSWWLSSGRVSSLTLYSSSHHIRYGCWPLAFVSSSKSPRMLILAQLLNSTAILIQVQAILVLQPTSIPKQKILGTYIHFFLNILSILCFIAAFIVIEINKGDHPRFTSPHGIMGLVTYIFIILQMLTGIAQFFAPVLVFGSVDNGKKIYKYHRVFGYVLLVLELGTVVAATQTDFNLTDLHIPLWSVLVSAILVLLGVGSRIRKSKFGLGR
jgi:cytochrome b561-like protein